MSFYLTTPIYYVNSTPHIGHAYTTIVGDILVRHHRQRGEETFFLTGVDEHADKVARVAKEQGLTPKEYVDQIVVAWQELPARVNASIDFFIRTTDDGHRAFVHDFLQRIHDNGDVYQDVYAGLYCVGCEAFKTEAELVDGKCPLHGTEPQVVEEDNYFFRLSDYTERLIELYETRPGFVRPGARRNEVLGKVRQGLDDLSISRVSFDWGIPIPWDEKHVIYVWVDALQNYITAIGYGWDDPNFRRIWPVDVHLIGKDILWFHTVIWHAMLMALDLPLPKTVFAHGYLQVGGEKMSKSRATAIHPSVLTDAVGVDGYRYHFMREFSFGLDGNYSWEGMIARYNSDLANDYGNLASRVLSMIGRYLDGIVPEPPTADETTPSESALVATQEAAFAEMQRAMDEVALHDVLKAAWSFVRKANSYVEEVTPWTLAKDPASARRLEVVLYFLADSLRLLALMTAPIMPRSTKELWERLGLGGRVEEHSLGDEMAWGRLVSGAKVRTGDPLFPRIEEAAS